MSKLGIVNDQLREKFVETGASFGLGQLVSVSRVELRSFHSVFRCEFDRGMYAVKRLVRRPDLPCWRDRFECAFAVEGWLSKEHSFFPKPIANLAGRAVAVVPPTAEAESTDWFIVHQWVKGKTPSPNSVTPRVFHELGAAITSIAQAPLTLVSELNGTDDEVPSVEEIIDLLERWQTTNTLVAQQRKRLKKVASTLRTTYLYPYNRCVPVVGHRDLSLANTLLTNTGKLFVLDWENVGLSSLESEIGRVLVHWCMGQFGSPLVGVEDVFRGVGSTAHALDDVSESWFLSWLGGHLMFLRYLLVSEKGNIFPVRAHTEIELLVQFAEGMPALLNTMRKVHC